MAATKATSKKAAKKAARAHAAAKKAAAPRSVKAAAPAKAKKAPGKAAKKAGASKSKAAASGSKAAAASKSKPKAAKRGAAKARAAGGKKAPAANAASAKTGKPSGAEAERPAKATGKAAADVPDFGGFPPGSVTRHEATLCLACIFRLFTNQLGLAPRTAYNEIRRYTPTVSELTAREPQRPFFRAAGEKNPRCPYCEAPRRWHAVVSVYRLEGGKASEAARRALLRALAAKEEQFHVQEESKTARQVFFEWLERLGQGLDLEDDEAWMKEAAREYLQRREPKTDWAELFDGVRSVRRSQRLEAGFERDGARLFLAPALYNDVLLVQYLVSRSHRHGGRTFEGRLTLPELVRRMRHGGHLEAHGITERDRFDVLEQLVERLTGGDAPARLHFVIDRRDLLEKAKTAYEREA